MRNYINLIEGASDSRDMEQKLRDLIDHPNTEPHLRDVAQRKLDKLIAAKIETDKLDAEEAEYATKSAAVPAHAFQVSFSKGWYSGPHGPQPFPQDKWGGIYMKGNGKTVTFQQVIDALRPLGVFRIDFVERPFDIVGPHVQAWFHPEDEPEDTSSLEKAMKPFWGGVAKEARYYRGGTSAYFISFSRFKPREQARKKKR